MSKKEQDGVVITTTFDASKSIRITYENENQFNKYVKSLRTYNMLAYKEFIFNLMYQLRGGKLVGEEVEPGLYRCGLPSNKLFEYVHGETYFTYRIDDGHVVVLLEMEPKEFLLAGHSLELQTYKGLPITGPKDRFKVDLYMMMNK